MPDLRFRHDPDYPSGGGGGTSLNRQAAEQHATKDFDPSQEIDIEEMGEFDMPNKLQVIFENWACRLRELNKDTEDAIKQYDAVALEVNGNFEQRETWLKEHGFLTVK